MLLAAVGSESSRATTARAEASGSTSGVPAWATAVASGLLGSNAPSVSNPYPQVLTVDQLVKRVYDTAIATRNFHALGHRSIDPATGNFLDADGRPTGMNAANPPGSATSGVVTPLTGCSSVNDPNPTCHAYGGTASSSYINGNTCYTNPTGYDGCMGAINYFDSSGPASGPAAPGRFGQYVYQF